MYLSFDDGPHPEITLWVLEELRKYGAEATFFCVGNNVELHEGVYRKIVEDGHAVGNHTYHHLNGWKTPDDTYLDDVAKACQLIRSNLFRPPYGRIRRKQAKKIPLVMGDPDARVVMWDVLSADFDQTISPARCLQNVVSHASEGSVVVFHDSEKAERNLRHSLPGTLKVLSGKGFSFKKIEL